jgi:hypothetical protein
MDVRRENDLGRAREYETQEVHRPWHVEEWLGEGIYCVPHSWSLSGGLDGTQRCTADPEEQEDMAFPHF